MMKFKLDEIVATSGVSELVSAGRVSLVSLVLRHMNCDWGDLCADDKQLNDQALKSGYEGRLFSSYQIDDQLKVWVITEWDRSVTTLLLPSEY